MDIQTFTAAGCTASRSWDYYEVSFAPSPGENGSECEGAHLKSFVPVRRLDAFAVQDSRYDGVRQRFQEPQQRFAERKDHFQFFSLSCDPWKFETGVETL